MQTKIKNYRHIIYHSLTFKIVVGTEKKHFRENHPYIEIYTEV